MLTVTCETPGILRADQKPKPVPEQGEVLVRIKRVGVCGTDLHIFSGDQPYLNVIKLADIHPMIVLD